MNNGINVYNLLISLFTYGTRVVLTSGKGKINHSSEAHILIKLFYNFRLRLSHIILWQRYLQSMSDTNHFSWLVASAVLLKVRYHTVALIMRSISLQIKFTNTSTAAYSHASTDLSSTILLHYSSSHSFTHAYSSSTVYSWM